MLYIDKNYRTGLGTSFYDRVNELNKLSEELASFNTIVVYGPRGVGKSELVRYLLRQRRASSIVIDARLLRARKLVPEELVPGELRDVVARVISEISQSSSLSLVGLVAIVLENLQRVLRAMRKPLYLVVDEYHLLPGVRGPEDAIRDLEAVASLLVKHYELESVRLLVTVSEGFIALSRARQRLLGYSTQYFLVEPMDHEHFSLLYNEYRLVRGCSRELDEVLGIVGSAPGYLADLCRLTRRMLIERIRLWLGELEAALQEAGTSLGLSGKELLARVDELLGKLVRPLEDPVLYRLGEALVERNILYPVFTGNGLIYRAQIPLYHHAIKMALNHGYNSILQLSAEELYESIAGR